MGTLSHVRAEMNFLDADGMSQKPTYYLCTPPAGIPQQNAKQTKRIVKIHDARARIHDISLDREGISFTKHETAVTNFYDAEEVRTVITPKLPVSSKR